MSDIKNMKVDEVAKKLTIEKALDIKLKLTPEEKKKIEEERDARAYFPFKNNEEMAAEFSNRQDRAINELDNLFDEILSDVEYKPSQERKKNYFQN